MEAKMLSAGFFLDNKYTRWYWKIVDRASSRKKPHISELHHILPKGNLMFPQFSNLKLNSWNGVHLTLREHFICHLLLTKMTLGEPRRSAIYGLMRFSSGLNKCNAREYEKAKKLFKAARKGCPNPLKGQPGRKWSDEEKKIHSEKMKRVMQAHSTREKCRNSKLGKPGTSPSTSHRLAISHAQRNLSVDQRKRKSLAKLGAKNGVYGKIWVTDGSVRRLVSPDSIPMGFYQKSKLRA